MKVIHTHPANEHYVRKIFEEKEEYQREQDNDFIHYIRPVWNSFQLKLNPHMDKEKWTGRWKVLQNDFFTYWDGKGEPPSWCVYFGFVEKEMEPYFLVHDNIRTFFDIGWGIGLKSKNNKQFLMKGMF